MSQAYVRVRPHGALAVPSCLCPKNSALIVKHRDGREITGDRRAKKAWLLPIVEIYDPHTITRSESDALGRCGFAEGGSLAEHRLALPYQVRMELGI